MTGQEWSLGSGTMKSFDWLRVMEDPRFSRTGLWLLGHPCATVWVPRGVPREHPATRDATRKLTASEGH